jgi:AcrR family transcriptional regulator
MTEERMGSGRGPSIWTRPERAARGPSPEHSRAEIAAAGITLADARGLAAVTMRSAAAAIGTAPASLYRYVATRDELVELMADQVYGELTYEPPSGQAAADLLRLARRARALYHRHPWLLDVPATGDLPGPNALAFIEHILAALAGADLTGPAKLETVGLFSGAVRLFAETEIAQLRAGQDTTEWQDSLAGYLVRIAAAGQHPHLAAALTDQPAAGADQPAAVGGQPAAAADQPAARGPVPPGPLFDRAMTRILTGLLPPSAAPPAGQP